MKNSNRNILPAVALLATILELAVGPVRGQHLNAGAISTSQGGQLYFQNGAEFVNTSGYSQPLNFASSGVYSGFFLATGPTFTALARTNASGPPSQFAAAAGSFLQVRLETVVSGPAGGVFSFWENGATSPTLSLFVGQTETSGNLFALSDVNLGAGTPGADPFGHLHGRRFTATLPGAYTVGFRILDTSINGAGGGPIQSPSELFLMVYNVPEPAFMTLAGVAAGIAILARRRTTRINPTLP